MPQLEKSHQEDPVQPEFKKRSLQVTNAGERVEEREPSYTVGGDVNQYRHHHGRQYGGFSEN